jgi:molybdenum cofactor guanylyltransferase
MAHSAAILAGGASRRFGGRDKAALLVDGRTILDQQVAALAPITDDIMLIGGAANHPLTRRLDDLVPGCGPLGGLHAALMSMRGDRVALIACDMPYVRTRFVAYLLSVADTMADQIDVVIPQTGRGLHPLCAVYARTCLERVMARLAERQLRMADLVADVRTHRVGIGEIERFGDPRRLLANVNTPGEYADLGALQSHKP